MESFLIPAARSVAAAPPKQFQQRSLGSGAGSRPEGLAASSSLGIASTFFCSSPTTYFLPFAPPALPSDASVTNSLHYKYGSVVFFSRTAVSSFPMFYSVPGFLPFDQKYPGILAVMIISISTILQYFHQELVLLLTLLIRHVEVAPCALEIFPSLRSPKFGGRDFPHGHHHPSQVIMT